MAISKQEKARRTKQSYQSYKKQWKQWETKGYPMEDNRPYTYKEFVKQHELSRRAGVKNIAREIASSQRLMTYSGLKKVSADLETTLELYQKGELETEIQLKEILTKKGKKEKKTKVRISDPKPIELTQFQKQKEIQLKDILKKSKRERLNIIGTYSKEIKGTVYHGLEAFYLDLKYTFGEDFADEMYGYGPTKS